MVKKKSVSGKCGVPACRAHVFYSGRVQGVGFRYTAEGIALECGLVGWVKNLPDGRVELVCEGSKEMIEVLFSRIEQSNVGRYIRKTAIGWEEPVGCFSDFIVEFHY